MGYCAIKSEKIISGQARLDFSLLSKSLDLFLKTKQFLTFHILSNVPKDLRSDSNEAKS